MKKLWLLIPLAFAACTDAGNARRILQAQGFRDIEITGYRPLGCSQEDNFRTGFRARSISGEIVTGIVCANPIKASTVRID